MIDSHCHLDHEPMFSDLENVILRSKESGVKKILSICTTKDSFRKIIDIVEFDISPNNNEIVTQEDKINQKKETELKEKISSYASSTNFGKPFTFTTESYQQFKLSTVKNLIINDKPSGYLLISENAKKPCLFPP